LVVLAIPSGVLLSISLANSLAATFSLMRYRLIHDFDAVEYTVQCSDNPLSGMRAEKGSESDELLLITEVLANIMRSDANVLIASSGICKSTSCVLCI
jgi:hypothetical protein